MLSQDEYHRHEVLHTASIVMQMFDDHVCSTVYVESDPELTEAAQAAFDALFAFYQMVGARVPDDDPATEDAGRRSAG